MEASLRSTMLVLLVVLVVGSCSSSDSTTTTEAAATTTTAADTTTTETSAASTSTDAGGEQVTIRDFAFNPGDVTVATGTTVTWTNGDGVNHTTTSDDELWDSGGLASGDAFAFVFDEPGVYAYHCNIHRTMTGTVTVEG